MQPVETVLRARRVVTPDGTAARWVGVHDGRIVAVEPYDTPVPSGVRVVDLGVDEVLLPGLVDTHVHVNEPGRTEWEGFATATRAAAAGGVTTLDRHAAELASRRPSTSTALEIKREPRAGQRRTSTSASGAARCRATSTELRGLHDAGVFGFKCFLLDSGVDGVPAADARRSSSRSWPRSPRFDALLIVHAEDAEAIDRAPAAARLPLRATSSPPGRAGAENLAIAEAASSAARWTGARAHVLHLSSSDALPMLASARRDGVAVTRRDLPALPDVHRRGDPRRRDPVQVLPADPRGRQPRAAVAGRWPTGVIDCVVSDHSPCTAGAQAARHRRLRRGVGRDLVAAAGAAGDLDAGPGARAHAGRRRAAGWPPGPRRWPG